MTSHFRRLFVVTVLVSPAVVFSIAGGAEYGVVLDGAWSSPGTWTPAGGPPGAADVAYIGLSFPLPALSAANVTLDVPPVVSSVHIGNGTLDLNGQTLTSEVLNLHSATALITKSGGSVQLGAITLQGGSTFAIDAADGLIGNVSVSGAASQLDVNTSFSLIGATISIADNGTLNANGAFTNTDGLIEVTSGGEFNASGDVTTGSVSLHNGSINLTGNALVCNGLSLDGASSAVNKASGHVQVGSLNLYNGADFVIDAADNLIRGTYVNAAGSHLVLNRAVNLNNDITISGAGVVDANADVTTNTAGVYLGSTLHMHGHTFTANSLILENTGTVDRAGGTVQLGSIRVYNAAHFAINMADSVTGSVTVEDATSSLAINKNVTLAGTVLVFNGGQLTTAGTMQIGGLWGLQTYNGTVDAGGDIDATPSTNGVGIAHGSALKLNGHTLTAHQFILGYSPYIGGDLPATLDRGAGGALAVDSLAVRKGSTLTVESVDTVTNSILVAESGSLLTLNRTLTLNGPVELADHGSLALNGHNLNVAGLLSVHPGTLDRTGGGRINVDSLSVAGSANVELRVADSIHSALTVSENSEVALVQLAGQTAGLSLDAGFSALAIDGTSQLALTFDAGSTVDDWALRWAGDHVAEITGLHALGQITWNLASETEVTVRSFSDGYTYVVFLPRAAGDYNGDDVVNAADYTVWRNTYGTANLAADGNRNGVVDRRDYEIWKLTYGEHVPNGSGTITVPEPGALSLLALAVLGMAGSRRRCAGSN